VFISGRNGSSRAWFLNEQPETLAAQSNLNPLNLSRFRMAGCFPQLALMLVSCSNKTLIALRNKILAIQQN
jgi:hypothetical protein